MAENEKEPEEQSSYSRATKAIVEQRVLQLVQLRLDGARGWDLCQFVAEKEQAGEHPWKMDADGKPLCRRSIERYASKADEVIIEQCATLARNALSLHLSRRERIYEKAMKADDLVTALAVLKDKATLEDLYPAKATKNEFTGRDGGPMELQHSGNVSHVPDLQSDDVLFAESLSRRTTEISPESGIHSNGEPESLDNGRHSDNGTNS